MSASKKCSKCGEIKKLTEFFFKNKGAGKYQSMCKTCCTVYKAEYDAKNKDIISGNKKKYYLENKTDILSSRKEYYNEHKEEKQKYNTTYYVQNKNEINNDAQARRKNRKKTDPAYKLREDISTIIRRILRRNGGSKYGNSILGYLPYNAQELKSHIENQFLPWMNWTNQGKYDPKLWNDNDPSTWTWQIDHIIPQSELPYTNMEDDNFKKCWALENLRPLRSDVNHNDGVTRKRHRR